MKYQRFHRTTIWQVTSSRVNSDAIYQTSASAIRSTSRILPASKRLRVRRGSPRFRPKVEPRKNGAARGSERERERGSLPDVISPRRVHKHFRLMQMRNDPADIMKKITRHVVSIDNEGTNIRMYNADM